MHSTASAPFGKEFRLPPSLTETQQTVVLATSIKSVQLEATAANGSRVVVHPQNSFPCEIARATAR